MLAGHWLPSDGANCRLNARTSGSRHFSPVQNGDKRLKLEAMTAACLRKQRQGMDCERQQQDG